MNNLQIETVEVVCTLAISDLAERNACPAALTWLQDNNYTDLVTAWEECNRADWMLWLLGGLIDDRRLLVQIACALVRRTPLNDGRMVWDLLTDERSRNVIQVAEQWIIGMATKEELYAAAAAAAAAAYAADADADAYAAAAYAAVAYAAAAAAADDDAADDDAAAYAAYAAAADAAGIAQANIVREYVILITEGLHE